MVVVDAVVDAMVDAEVDAVEDDVLASAVDNVTMMSRLVSCLLTTMSRLVLPWRKSPPELVAWSLALLELYGLIIP